MDTKRIVHVGCEEGEGGSEARTEDTVGGKDGGCENGVGVNQVVHNRQEYEDHAKPKRDASSNACSPR